MHQVYLPARVEAFYDAMNHHRWDECSNIIADLYEQGEDMLARKLERMIEDEE